ncbi:unnamed protein product, partial [marine sediment metagenome]
LEGYNRNQPPEFLTSCVRRAFEAVSQGIEDHRVSYDKESGSTCCIFIRIDEAWGLLAWVGDSRAHVFEKEKLVFTTSPHIPLTIEQKGQLYSDLMDPETGEALVVADHAETARIRNRGGFVFLPETYMQMESFQRETKVEEGKKHYQISPYLWFCGCGSCRVGGPCHLGSFFLMTTRSFGDHPADGPLYNRFKNVFSAEPSFSEIFEITDDTVVLQCSDGFTDVADDELPSYMCRDLHSDLSFRRLHKLICDKSFALEDRAAKILADIKDRYTRLWHISADDITQMDDVCMTIYQKLP